MAGVCLCVSLDSDSHQSEAARQQSLAILTSPPPTALGLPHPASHVGTGDLNLGPLARTVCCLILCPFDTSEDHLGRRHHN